ncbi:hypothetical protein PFAG_02221 [Plasmodium falciparum Santa Lucia]|uniref:Uncharacterized protein n=1 Tax=Plasmodium falciparum Santa Lucia TaxID=478859 RepID=W7FX92_PLAFA|nr:hypothetical protein PFAG_02221 [Plasmodium falciparum Santa Lucia]
MNDENIILDFISVSFVHRNLSEYYIGIYAALRNYYRQQSGVYKKYYSGKLKKDICYDTLEEDADEASHDEPVNKYSKKNKQGLKENIARKVLINIWIQKLHVCKLGGDDIICTLEICEEVCLSKYKKVILPHGGGLPKKKKKNILKDIGKKIYMLLE